MGEGAVAALIIQGIAATAQAESARQGRKQSKAAASKTKKAQAEKTRETSELEEKERNAVEREQNLLRLQKDKAKRGAKGGKNKGRAGTILTNKQPGATTGTSTAGGSTGATKTLLGL